MHLTITDHWWTGQSKLSLDLCWVMVSSLSSLFWNSNIIETVSARARTDWSWWIRWQWRKNWMLLKVRIVGCLSPDTLRYLHDLIAKKNAPISSWLIAISLSVLARLKSLLSTEQVSTFWGFSEGSKVEYFLNCGHKMIAIFPLMSRWGSSLL